MTVNIEDDRQRLVAKLRYPNIDYNGMREYMKQAADQIEWDGEQIANVEAALTAKTSARIEAGLDPRDREARRIIREAAAALASPSEGNKKGEEPKIIDDDLLDIYVGMRRGHDWPGKSRPQEQPRKATPEMVDAAVRDYGKWASGGASRERIEHTLNAALAVSVSPAAAQGWQTTKAADLPPPHTLIDDGRDQCALMFHYLPADVSFKAVADERGYDIIAVPMENDPAAADLLSRYEDGEDVIADWKPTIPDGWLFGAKIDTEDGASAIFIRKQLPAAPPSPAAQEQKPGAIIWDNMP